MQPIPTNLMQSLPAHLLGDAQTWWSQLADEERDELVELCDARKEVFLFETFSVDSQQRVTGGKFLPHDDSFGIAEWGEDYFQHLLDHPELVIAYDADRRTFFRICSRHREARQCVTTLSIAASFVCPFGDAQCRMHQVLGDRNEVALRPLAKLT